MEKLQSTFLHFDETKSDDTSHDPKFQSENYQFPSFCRDRNCSGCGKICLLEINKI